MRLALPVRLVLALVSLLLLPASLLAQTYTSVLVFGDSLSDTGNVAHLTQSQYMRRVPGPAYGYTDGSFTDGTDTSPAASLYTGVWIKQLASTFPAHPAVIDSLDGGTNYAFGYATTGTGTSTLAFSSTVSVNVDNIGQQITNYLNTFGTVPAHTLVVVWGGANDLLTATSATAISAAATTELAQIQRLVTAGATDILVANLPPLGVIPRLNATPVAAAQATAAAQLFNGTLAAGLATLPAQNPTHAFHIYPLDIYTLINTVIASPTTYGLANVTLSSQAMSVNPDTFLFWDDLHPTTTGHHLIALAAATLLNTPTTIPTTTSFVTSSNPISVGRALTLTATVTATTGATAPTGTVTFLDGTTTLGTATLAATTSTTSTATFTTSTLTAGAHALTTAFATSGIFTASTSAVITETVTTPSISIAAAPSTLTVFAGSAGTSAVTITPSGGFTGTVTLTCPTLPTNTLCAASPATLTFTGSSAAQTSNVTLTAHGSSPSALLAPTSLPGLLAAALSAALFLTLARRRRALPHLLSLALLAAVSAAGLLGLAGCGSSNSNNTTRGSYTVPVVATPSTGAAVTANLTLIVQ